MREKLMFYFMWGLQLFAQLSFLAFGIVYIIIGIEKGSFEIAKMSILFFAIFAYQQRKKSKNTLRELFQDRRDFINSQDFWVMGSFMQINERYSLKHKKKIPENKLRKMKGGRYVGQAEIEPFNPQLTPSNPQAILTNP